MDTKLTGPSLVSTEWLNAHMTDPSVRIIEVYFDREKNDYATGHIPGAISWYWRDALWDDLRRQFPSPSQIAERLGQHGISAESTVVFYSAEAQFSVYGAWVLGTMCGHPDVRILNGGKVKWTGENRPLSAEPAKVARAHYEPHRRDRDDSSRIGRDAVRDHLGRPGVVLVDVRSAEEYAGLRVMPPPGFDHGAERSGRIPGAAHVPYTELLNPDTSFRSAPEIEAAFRRVGAAPENAERTIVYCRLGHRASLAWYAMTHILGWQHARVYDGSWTEWGNSVDFPIER